MRPACLLTAVLLVASCASYTPPTVRRPPGVPRSVSSAFVVEQGAERVVPPEANQKEVEGLTLDGVLRSVENHFPELAIARLELEAAEARILQAQGAFDTTLSIDSKNNVQGFYEYQVLDALIEQPIEEGGATVFGGYRFGLGDFASYDGDIQTNDGGEVALGISLPLLRNSAIDKRRANLWRARFENDAADPRVHEVRVLLTRKASAAYWKAVAASAKIEVARSLLDLARTRRDSLREAVAQGELPEIILVDNDRLIADREAILQAATRDFERSAIALSLYFRDAGGQPVRATLDDVPAFPEIPDITEEDLEAHVQFGLKHRPELQVLAFELAGADVEREQRNNELLPKLDVFGVASQDLGASSTSKGVYDPFEFAVGAKLEVPLQRRAAKGKLVVAQTKIAQLREKARFQADKIEGEIRDTASAYRRARQRLVATARSAELAAVLEQAERDRLGEGESDLLRVNLREQTTAKARSGVIEARARCFIALADYRAAMGLPEPIRD